MPGQRLGGLWVEPFSIAGPPVLYSFLDKLPEAIVTLEGQDAAPEEYPEGFRLERSIARRDSGTT